MRMNDNYPPLPARELFAIGEAAALALVKPHTVRYWEKHIPPLRARVVRRGGRRYYNRDAVLMLRRIAKLIGEESQTVAGVRQRLTTKKSGNAIEYACREIEKIIKLL